MDSSVFAYEPGWVVSSSGADTTEPQQPWQQPSGRMAFRYGGRELALQLALGDYWGYIFVTVNGRPANGLAVLRGNLNSVGQPSGYKPLFVPEKQTPAGPATEWLVVHRAGEDGPHEVTVEVWRGWGQTVLRGVAVDALPPDPLPQWPGILLALLGSWFALSSLGTVLKDRLTPTSQADVHNTPARIPSVDHLGGAMASIPSRFKASLARPMLPWPYAAFIAVAAVLTIGTGVYGQSWVVTVGGLAALGAVALLWPVLWSAAFALRLALLPSSAADSAGAGAESH